MRLEKAAFLLLLALMSLTACSDEVESDVLARYDDDGVKYSPTSLGGTLYFLKNMIPQSVRVINLDKQLNPLDSADAELFLGYGSNFYSFSVAERDYDQPFVKIVTVFPMGTQGRMEIPQYVPLQESNYNKELSFAKALMSGRIETLVREKGYGFQQAWSQAVKELRNALNTSMDDVFSTNVMANNVGYSWGRLNGVLPYVYCHREYSDSEFYRTFQDFNKSFAKNGSIDESLIVDAADVWLSSFELDDRDGRTYSENMLSDDDVGVKYLSSDFMAHAYGIDLSVSAGMTDKFVVIENKKSMYDGRTFIYDYKLSKWRLKTLLEDSVGICMSEKDSVAKNGDRYYRCLRGSAKWEELTDRDTLLNAFYGVCGNSKVNNGYMVYLRDSLFVCEGNKSKDYAWTDKYLGQVFDEGDSLYASYINAVAIRQFGRCSDAVETKKKLDDDVYVHCFWDKWTVMDSLEYYLGFCKDSNYVGEYLGKYYACKKFNEYNVKDGKWSEIPAPVYFDDKCFIKQAEDKMTLKCNDEYFICDIENGYYKWRKILESEVDESVTVGTCSFAKED